MNVAKQIAYWRVGSEEDIEVAQELLAKGRLRHGLFFMHLALEKMLKAHVVKTTKTPPPKLHNLPRLTELAGLQVSSDQMVLFRELNMYQLEILYLESDQDLVDGVTAQVDMKNAGEVLEWMVALL